MAMKARSGKKVAAIEHDEVDEKEQQQAKEEEASTLASDGDNEDQAQSSRPATKKIAANQVILRKKGTKRGAKHLVEESHD